MRLDAHEIVLVCGRGGTGKSTFLASLTRTWPSWATWVHDPNADPLWDHIRGHSCWDDSPPPMRDCYWILDEVDMLYPASGSAAGWVVEGFKRGRHRGIRIACACQRPTMLHPSARRNVRVVYLGQLQADDLAVAVREWGPQAEQAGQLEKFQFIRIEA